jgi:hypothetical protein
VGGFPSDTDTPEGCLYGLSGPPGVVKLKSKFDNVQQPIWAIQILRVLQGVKGTETRTGTAEALDAQTQRSARDVRDI